MHSFTAQQVIFNVKIISNSKLTEINKIEYKAQMDDDYYDDEDRINGGSPVRKGEFPFIVSVQSHGYKYNS